MNRAYPRRMTGTPAAANDPGDSLRIALAMVRADWQQDRATWEQLWAVATDQGEVAIELSRLARELLEKLAMVGGVSTGEMLHRMAQQLIPHPDASPAIRLVDLEELAHRQP
jgi:hypothetical protein